MNSSLKICALLGNLLEILIYFVELKLSFKDSNIFFCVVFITMFMW